MIQQMTSKPAPACARCVPPWSCPAAASITPPRPPHSGRRCHARPAIEAVFKRHRRRYGYRRIGAELSDSGIVALRLEFAA